MEGWGSCTHKPSRLISMYELLGRYRRNLAKTTSSASTQPAGRRDLRESSFHRLYVYSTVKSSTSASGADIFPRPAASALLRCPRSQQIATGFLTSNLGSQFKIHMEFEKLMSQARRKTTRQVRACFDDDHVSRPMFDFLLILKTSSWV